jgi:hypothetical protein
MRSTCSRSRRIAAPSPTISKHESSAEQLIGLEKPTGAELAKEWLEVDIVTPYIGKTRRQVSSKKNRTPASQRMSGSISTFCVTQ